MAGEQANAEDRPRTVAELLSRIARERGALEEAVSGMSDEDFVTTSGGWSVKDHLAHVAAWERRLLGEMQGDRAAARFGPDEAIFDTGNTDAINAMIHARHRDDSPETVRAEFRAAGEALHAAIAGLDAADLLQPVRPDDPMVDTLADLISWDTYRHYPDHVAAITGHA
jgi:uncharacterized damage-inducible protein DinB